MRDPAENKEWHFSGGTWDPERQSAIDPIGMALEFNPLANTIRERARLLAFTRDKKVEPEFAQDFGRGWSRARMWEYYAEKHAGVCLLFDKVSLTRNICESLEGQGLFQPYHRPVEYELWGPYGQTLDLSFFANRAMNAASVAEYIEAHNDQLFFVKALDWETENEYRFVMTAPEDQDDVFVEYADSLEAVIVGEKFPDWERPGAIKACRRSGADPLGLDWSERRPRLANLEGQAIDS
jgi:hypothetical protein